MEQPLEENKNENVISDVIGNSQFRPCTVDSGDNVGDNGNNKVITSILKMDEDDLENEKSDNGSHTPPTLSSPDLKCYQKDEEIPEYLKYVFHVNCIVERIEDDLHANQLLKSIENTLAESFQQHGIAFVKLLENNTGFEEIYVPITSLESFHLEAIKACAITSKCLFNHLESRIPHDEKNNIYKHLKNLVGLTYLLANREDIYQRMVDSRD